MKITKLGKIFIIAILIFCAGGVEVPAQNRKNRRKLGEPAIDFTCT